MAKFCLMCCFAMLLQASVGVGVDCSATAGDKSTCQSSDHAALLQGRVRVSLEADAATNQYTYGPYLDNRPMMDYFKAWGKGKLRSHVARTLHVDLDVKGINLAQLNSRTLTTKEASTAFMATAAAECPEQASILAQMATFSLLETEPMDADGVMHMLLRGQSGELQYMAVRKEADGQFRTLVADPPVCMAPAAFLQQAPLQQAPKRSPGGEPQLLDLNDEAVQDCKKLFHRTAMEVCQTDMTLTVLAATAGVIDGVDVHLEAKVCHGDTCRMHHPECTFEKDRNHADASLSEVTGSAAPGPTDVSEKTEGEKQGLHATLKLHVPLCDADKTDGVNAAQASEMNMMEQFRMGENSHYKGFEHVNDHLPKWSALEGVTVEGELDLRNKYPSCYPALAGKGVGSEVVRNQGTCGSCWAFASASTTMTNLCVSVNGAGNTHNSAQDRMEVSVQKIISCKPEGYNQQQGCNGGNMGGWDSGASAWGLTAEKDNLYKCGGGNPKNHFEQKSASCDAFPWGGACTGQAQSAWFWGGSASLSGEQPMLTHMATGQSLYGSLDVYGNFMNLKANEVYKAIVGSVKGGHAVNIMGYGIQDGTKYWLLENSWGTTSWGDGGYGKILRGTNLAGIETNAFAARAWVQGGTEPPCHDSTDGTGLSSNGRPPYIPCSQAKGGRYGDLCSGYATAKKRCMKTCGGCGGFNGAGTSSPPSPPPPPPAPAPPPPAPAPPAPAAASCADWTNTHITMNGSPATCADLAPYCGHYPIVQERCPASCGKCR